MSKKLVLVLTMVLMLVFVSSIAFAGGATDEGDDCDPGHVWDEDMGCVAVFEDGRLNAFDMIATAVGYLDVKECITVNTDDDLEWDCIVQGLEIWVIDGSGVGQLALYIPGSELVAASAAGVDVTIAEGGGAAMGYTAATNSFWFTGPGGYMFTWEA